MPTCKFLLCHALGILQDYISYHGYSLTDNTEASITFLSISVQDETEILDLFPNETRILFDGLTLWLEMAEKRLDLMGRDFDEGSTSDDEQLVRRTKVRKYKGKYIWCTFFAIKQRLQLQDIKDHGQGLARILSKT